VVSHRAGCCILCGILAHKVSILAIICGMVIVGAFIGILTTLPFNCEDWREKYDD
jgi:type III secretory pathway component EscT